MNVFDINSLTIVLNIEVKEGRTETQSNTKHLISRTLIAQTVWKTFYQ
jgi:hypothetical protein